MIRSDPMSNKLGPRQAARPIYLSIRDNFNRSPCPPRPCPQAATPRLTSIAPIITSTRIVNLWCPTRSTCTFVPFCSPIIYRRRRGKINTDNLASTSAGSHLFLTNSSGLADPFAAAFPSFRFKKQSISVCGPFKILGVGHPSDATNTPLAHTVLGPQPSQLKTKAGRFTAVKQA